MLASINTGGGGNGGELEEGGKVVGAGGKQGEGYAGEEETKRELRLYDRKVWKAYGEMVRATERELAKLGIPFFCIEEGLVEKGRQGGAGGGEGKGGEGKVGEKELEALKGRMVGLLEDLVAE